VIFSADQNAFLMLTARAACCARRDPQLDWEKAMEDGNGIEGGKRCLHLLSFTLMYEMLDENVGRMAMQASNLVIM